jgi:hypothetical protein
VDCRIVNEVFLYKEEVRAPNLTARRDGMWAWRYSSTRCQLRRQKEMRRHVNHFSANGLPMWTLWKREIPLCREPNFGLPSTSQATKISRNDRMFKNCLCKYLPEILPLVFQWALYWLRVRDWGNESSDDQHTSYS